MSSPNASKPIFAERSSELNGSSELKICGVRKRVEDTEPVTSNAAVTNCCIKKPKTANEGGGPASEVATFAEPEAQAVLTSAGSTGNAEVLCPFQEMQKKLDAFAVKQNARVAVQSAHNAALRQEFLSELTKKLDEVDKRMDKKLGEIEQKMDELQATLKTTFDQVFQEAATKPLKT